MGEVIAPPPSEMGTREQEDKQPAAAERQQIQVQHLDGRPESILSFLAGNNEEAANSPEEMALMQQVQEVYGGADEPNFDELVPKGDDKEKVVRQHLSTLIKNAPEADLKRGFDEISKALFELKKESSIPVTEQFDQIVGKVQNKLGKAIVRLIRYGTPLGVLALALPGGNIFIASLLAGGTGLFAAGHTQSMMPQLQKQEFFYKNLESQQKALKTLPEHAYEVISGGLEEAETIQAQIDALSNFEENNGEQIKILTQRLKSLQSQLKSAIGDAQQQAEEIRSRIDNTKYQNIADRNIARSRDPERIRQHQEDMATQNMSETEIEKLKREAEFNKQDLQTALKLRQMSQKGTGSIEVVDENARALGAINSIMALREGDDGWYRPGNTAEPEDTGYLTRPA